MVDTRAWEKDSFIDYLDGWERHRGDRVSHVRKIINNGHTFETIFFTLQLFMFIYRTVPAGHTTSERRRYNVVLTFGRHNNVQITSF